MDPSPVPPEFTGAYPGPKLAETSSTSAVVEGPGTRIGPYKLLQQIGAGGMGVVFMADQEHPVRRRVAFKIIKPGMDSEQVVGRFEAERQALAMMDHQHIAKVLDAGTTATGRPFFVMELVHGVPITKYCDENKLTPRERLELFLPICHAIQHAHQKGIIHRDIKPSNVLVTLYDGKPVAKVIDFGLAKAMEQRLTERTMFTQFGAIVGTFEYMAPEQAEMSALGVDTRSDIYSLGVLLYELLTGTTPHSRQALRAAAYSEMVRIIKEEEPPRPSTRLSSTVELATIAAQRRTEPAKLAKLLRGELDWIVMKCLEKDRTRRYETANGLARDLVRYLNDEPVEACPPSVAYRLRKFARKYKAGLATAAAFVALLVVGVVASIWLAVRAGLAEADAKVQRDAALVNEQKARDSEQTVRKQRDEADQQRKAVERFADLLGRAREDLRHTLYATDMSLIQAAWETDNVARVLELLERQIPKEGEADLRGFEWHYWRRLCHGDLRTLKLAETTVPRFMSMVHLSPDGSRCCLDTSTKTGASLKIFDTAAGKELLAIPREARSRFRSAAFDRTGSLLAAIATPLPPREAKPKLDARSEINVWDVRSGKRLSAIPLEGVDPQYHLALSADGARVAVVPGSRFGPKTSAKTDIKIWESRTGKHVGDIAVVGSTSEPVFSADGTRLAVAVIQYDEAGGISLASQVQVWDVAGQQKILTLEASAPLGTFTSIAFSPDGARIACSSLEIGASTTVYLWDAKSGKQLLTMAGTNAHVAALRFSPDGKVLAGFGGDLTIRLWDAVSGKLRRTLKGHAEAVTDAAFSPDGQRLLSVSRDGVLKTWDPTFPEEPAPTRGPATSFVAGSTLSPDGSRIARPPRFFGRSAAAAKPPTKLELTILDVGGKPLRSVPLQAGHAHGIAFNRDGTRLALAWHLFADDANLYELRAWEATSGRELLTIPADGTVTYGQVAVSADGARLAVAYAIVDKSDKSRRGLGGGAKIFDLATGKELVTFHKRSGGQWAGVAFSPDGTRLAAASAMSFQDEPDADQQATIIWDIATRQEVVSLQGEADSLAFSPDGKLLAGAASGRQVPSSIIRLWRAGDGTEVATLKGHNGWISSLDFSPDSRRLVSAARLNVGPWGELKVWDTAGGQELLTLKSRSRSIDSMVFSADGRRLIATGSFSDRPDDVVQIWDATPVPGR